MFVMDATLKALDALSRGICLLDARWSVYRFSHSSRIKISLAKRLIRAGMAKSIGYNRIEITEKGQEYLDEYRN